MSHTTTLKRFGLAGLTSLVLGISGAYAAEHTLTFGHVLIEGTPNALAAEEFKRVVEENSDGRIAVNIRPAAQLGGDVEILEQTQMGMVDIAIPPTGNLANFAPKMFLYDLPYLIPDEDGMKRLLDGDVGRELLDSLEDHDLYGVNYWGAGFRNMTNNIRPINEPDDLKNIKMRVLQAPTLLSTYRAYGANPTAMAYTEVYNGLQQGVVEGQENPLANIDSMKFYEVQKYMTLTAHTYHTYAAVMNKAKWESLPEDLQEIVRDAFDKGRDFAREATIKDEKEILARIKDEIEIIELTDEGREKFIEASKPIYDEFEGNITPEILERAIKAASGE